MGERERMVTNEQLKNGNFVRRENDKRMATNVVSSLFQNYMNVTSRWSNFANPQNGPETLPELQCKEHMHKEVYIIHKEQHKNPENGPGIVLRVAKCQSGKVVALTPSFKQLSKFPEKVAKSDSLGSLQHVCINREGWDYYCEYIKPSIHLFFLIWRDRQGYFTQPPPQTPSILHQGPQSNQT